LLSEIRNARRSSTASDGSEASHFLTNGTNAAAKLLDALRRFRESF
jgi:hypothetical protein